MNSRLNISERPMHGLVAKILFPTVAAIVITYLGMFARNVGNNIHQDVTTMGHQIGSVVVPTGLVRAAVKAEPVRPEAAQAVVRTSKNDKGVFFNDEEPLDTADAEIADEDKASSKHMLAGLSLK